MKSSMSKSEGFINCARYALVVLNVLFFLFGTFLLCLGAWLRWIPANKYLLIIATTSTTRGHIDVTSAFMLSAGGATAVLAVLGCCGALSNSKYVLGMFSLFLLVLLVLLVVVFGLSVWLNYKVKADVTHQLTTTFVQSFAGSDANDVISRSWNQVQRDLKCCGIRTKNGDLDYSTADGRLTQNGVTIVGAKYWREANEPSWPASCCVRNASNDVMDVTSCRFNKEQNQARYKTGCVGKVESFLTNNFIVASFVAALLILVQVLHFCVLRLLEASDLEETESVITIFSFDKGFM